MPPGPRTPTTDTGERGPLTLSPRTYRRVVAVALALLCAIVVTGAAVRLSGSGLGCDDWPNCSQDQVFEFGNPNQTIEQVNRLFFADGRWRVNLLCNLGYGDPAAIRPRWRTVRSWQRRAVTTRLTSTSAARPIACRTVCLAPA